MVKQIIVSFVVAVAVIAAMSMIKIGGVPVIDKIKG